MLAQAAVHIVDGELEARFVGGTRCRVGCLPVHTVGSCSRVRGRKWGRPIDCEKTRMRPCVGSLVPPRDRGSCSLLARRFSAHGPQAAARYTAAGVRYPRA